MVDEFLVTVGIVVIVAPILFLILIRLTPQFHIVLNGFAVLLRRFDHTYLIIDQNLLAKFARATWTGKEVRLSGICRKMMV